MRKVQNAVVFAVFAPLAAALFVGAALAVALLAPPACAMTRSR